MQRKRKSSNNTIPVAVFFILFVIFLILSSVAVKLGIILSKSRFDGDHRFTIAIKKQNKKEAQLLSFAPDTNSISVLTVTSSKNLPELQSFFETPVDGEIITDNIPQPDEPTEGIKHAVFFYKTIQTNLTIVDLLRLFHFSADVPRYSITSRQFSLDSSSASDTLFVDKLVSSQFGDNQITSEKKTIHIVNATGIPGFGGRLGRLIINMGGIVVAITTSDSVFDRSNISYVGQKSYTVERLSHVLSFETKQLENNSLSDIVITLGKDSSNTHTF